MLTRGTSGGGCYGSGPSLKVRLGRVRHDRDAVSSEPANARLTAETKPFRGRKTSQPAYSQLVFNSTSRKITSL